MDQRPLPFTRALHYLTLASPTLLRAAIIHACMRSLVIAPRRRRTGLEVAATLHPSIGRR
jgi:hypothetical protein